MIIVYILYDFSLLTLQKIERRTGRSDLRRTSATAAITWSSSAPYLSGAIVFVPPSGTSITDRRLTFSKCSLLPVWTVNQWQNSWAWIRQPWTRWTPTQYPLFCWTLLDKRGLNKPINGCLFWFFRRSLPFETCTSCKSSVANC